MKEAYILVNNIIHELRGDYYYPVLDLTKFDQQITEEKARTQYIGYKKKNPGQLYQIEQEKGILSYFPIEGEKGLE